MKSLSIPPVYLLLSCIIIIGSHWVFPVLNIIPFPYNLLGLLILMAGLYFLGTAYKLFSIHRTPINYDKSTAIITEGIFKHTRNPMYVGMVLILSGLSLCFGNAIALIVPFLFYLIINRIFIPFEERKMEETFGEEYLEYKSKVKRWYQF